MPFHKDGLPDEPTGRKQSTNCSGAIEELRLPEKDLAQDEEWCEIVVHGEKRRIRFHDYADVFRIPGLYEELFYGHLECCSPSYLSNLLDVLAACEAGAPCLARVLVGRVAGDEATVAGNEGGRRLLCRQWRSAGIGGDGATRGEAAAQ